MNRKLIAFACLTAVISVPASTAQAAPTAPDPAGFVTVVDNPYFPLPVGTTFVYRGVVDGEKQVDRVTVTDKTRVIQGVTTTIVRDVAKHGTRLIEKTFDWYAQDDQGNVWYFGEDTAEYDADGNVISTEGSWEAGVDGAEAGIIMLADPRPPTGYRQELYEGHAEDQSWVLSRGGTLTVPYGRVRHVLRTMEWTPLEPRVVGVKFYAPGLGIVMEKAVAGGDELAVLVDVRTP